MKATFDLHTFLLCLVSPVVPNSGREERCHALGVLDTPTAHRVGLIKRNNRLQTLSDCNQVNPAFLSKCWRPKCIFFSHVFVFAKTVFYLYPISWFNSMATCSTKPFLTHPMLHFPTNYVIFLYSFLLRRLCRDGSYSTCHTWPWNIKTSHWPQVLWWPTQPGPFSYLCSHSTPLVI